MHADLELDLYDGDAWVTVTAFRVTGARVRGLPPAPTVSSYRQVNVRTYVRRGDRPGVWFLGVDLSSPVVASAAATLLGLPAHRSRIAHERYGKRFEVSSSREDAERPTVFSARWQPIDRAALPVAGWLEAFLTERFCLYCSGRRRALLRVEAHHAPWRLQPAEGEVQLNTVVPDGIRLAGAPVLNHSRRQDFLIWRPRPATPSP